MLLYPVEPALNPKVLGSNPSPATNKNKALQEIFCEAFSFLCTYCALKSRIDSHFSPRPALF